MTRYSRPCTHCEVESTRSATTICSKCRADNVPAVEWCDGEYLRVGNHLLSTHAALTLAHKIADTVGHRQ